MAKIKFFVEGTEDRNFIKQYCSIILNSSFSDSDFFIMGSWSGYKTGGVALPDFAINTDYGGVNVLIVDADNDFAQRQAEIFADKAKLDFNADLFLFPNQKDTGCLENLLTEIAVDRKLIECFKNYEECVKDYNKPLLKGRIYTYLDTILHPYAAKSKSNDLRLLTNYDFSNKTHWDLNNIYLQPLFNFLSPYL